VRLSADFERLVFLRVLRSVPNQQVTDPGGLVAPPGTAATLEGDAEASDG